MKRNIHCVIKKKAVFKNEISIEADYTVPGIVSGNTIKLVEPDKTKTLITINPKRIVIERSNNQSSRLELAEGETTIYIMKANFGYSLKLNVYTLNYKLLTDSISVVYQTEADKDNLEIHTLDINIL